VHYLDANEAGVGKHEELTRITGKFRVPLLFVGGKFVGGFTSVKNALEMGTLRTLLGIAHAHDTSLNEGTPGVRPGIRHPSHL
jgi:hypothetical protein